MTIRLARRAPRVGALLLFWAAALAAAPQLERVEHVLDGDTLILEGGQSVRLIGINCPEMAREDRPAEPLAAEARDHLAARVLGRRVQVLAGEEPRDRHGRLLATVLLPNGNDVQAGLLEAGLALAIAIPPNIDRLADYRAAEARARSARRGLWAQPGHAPRAAGELDKDETGFRRVTGTVGRIGKSRKYIYLDLSPGFSITVPRQDWRRYFRDTPEDWLDRNVEVRGWISRYNRGLRMRIQHPAMIESTP